MSGIFGIWHRDGRPLERGLLARMAGTLGHRGRDGVGLYEGNAAALGCQNLWVTPESVGALQPIGEGSTRIAFDGRLDNRGELIGALGAAPSLSDAALALAAYRHWGEAFLDRFVGDFALALFDGTERRLILGRDALGARPLYYFESPKAVVFASEIKAILLHPAVPNEPDDDGIADCLLESNRPLLDGQRTCFRDIAAVVPSHRITFSPTGREARRYWDFDPYHRLKLGSLGEYAEGFREALGRALARRLRSAYPVAVSTSGGLDSSSLFCLGEALRRAGEARCPRLVGFTYRHSGKDGDETPFVEAIEHQYGVRIERIDLDRHVGIVRGIEDQIWHIEAPMAESLWGADVAVHGRAAQAGARLLLTGHWGDQVLFCQNYLVDLFRRFAWGTLRHHLAEYARWYLPGEMAHAKRLFLLQLARRHTPHALVPLFKRMRRPFVERNRGRSLFSERLRSRARRLSMGTIHRSGGFHSAQAQGLYLEARSKYHVHALEVNNKVASLFGIESAYPFLDRDLIQFLMAVPGEVQNWQGVPRGLLRESLRGIVPTAIAERRWKADFTDAVNEGIERDGPEIARRLSSDSRVVARGYVEPAELRRGLGFLSKLDTRDSVQAWAVSDLLGLEVWLQLFGRKPASELV